MIIFKLLELVLVIGVIVFMVTQIIYPSYTKRLMFPMFRKQWQLEKREAELNQLKMEREMTEKLNIMKKGK